jgi:glycosyltransferase involved in cell wall biosynthesis
VRILALNWRDRVDPMAGGAEVHLHEILRRLVQRGHQVTWLCCSYPGAAAEEIADDGIRYRRRGHWAFTNFSVIPLLRDELKRNPYDVVLEDINKVPFYAPLFTKLPVLAVIPHLFGRTVFRETNPAFATYVWLSEQPLSWIYRNCWFEAISDSTREDLVHRGVKREQIEVVHCGMDHDRYVLDDPPARASAPRIVHLGRLRRYKSVDVVIDALARIREVFADAELDVIGDGPDRPRLIEYAASHGLADAVHFRGHLPRTEIVETLYRSHLFLNPSPKEGWGLTVIEANECGVPVVASRRPGLVDSVRDGETGLLADYGDPEDFANKALSLLTDPPLWRMMSENAVRWARSFSWDDAALETERMLERCRR